MNIKGALTALVTPFDEDGNLDEEGFRENIRWQIDKGIDGIVPAGTTGECATLSHEEHQQVVEITIDEAGGGVPVVAGTGSNSTREALMLTEHAAEEGADAALLVGPYYNRPTQRGIYEHFKKVAKEVDIPQIIYNIPSRTGQNIEAETVVRLSNLENIVGIKEASGDLKQIMQIARDASEEFSIISGDDSLTLSILSLEGVGGISVATNLVPGRVSRMINSFLEGDYELARRIHMEILPLFRVLSIETNPGPIKAAMELLGKPAGRPRLPLVEVERKSKGEIERVLNGLGLKSND